MKLSNHQILDLSNAIAALDGRTEMRLVEGKAVPVFISYDFRPAARLQLARNQRTLQEAIAVFNIAKDAMIQQHSGGTGAISQESPAWTKCVAELDKLRLLEIEIPLLEMAEADLADANLPISILTSLLPLIA